MNSISFNLVPKESTCLNGMLNTGCNELSIQGFVRSRVETFGRCFFAAAGSLVNVLPYTLYALGDVCALDFQSVKKHGLNAVKSFFGTGLLVMAAVVGFFAPKTAYEKMLGGKVPTKIDFFKAKLDEANKEVDILNNKLQGIQNQLNGLNDAQDKARFNELQAQANEVADQLSKAKAQLDKVQKQLDEANNDQSSTNSTTTAANDQAPANSTTVANNDQAPASC